MDLFPTFHDYFFSSLLQREKQSEIISLPKVVVIVNYKCVCEISETNSHRTQYLLGIQIEHFRILAFQMGFKLEENITVQGISSESLMITCREAVGWGNSFKSLSRLVTPDPQTGKLQQDGLIFKVTLDF